MEENRFDVNITADDSQYDLSIKRLWEYRDLVLYRQRI